MKIVSKVISTNISRAYLGLGLSIGGLGASRTVGFGQRFISKPFSEEEIKAAVWRLGKQGTRARRLSNFLLSSFLRYCEA